MPFDEGRDSLQPGRALTGPVLITGATGFVGSHVADRLARFDVTVRALVRRTSDTRRLRALGVELIEGSLSDEDSVRRAVQGAAAVVHLGALTRARTEAEFQHVNGEGTAMLVRAAASADPRPRRFVYLSSLAAVGPPVDGKPVRPDDPARPITAYGRSKRFGETACLDAADVLDIAVLRAPAVYGPGDRDLYTFFRLASLGVLPMPAGPVRPLQLVHIEDLVDAVVRALSAPAGTGIVHIAEERAYAWEQVARLVADAVGSRARVVRIPVALFRFCAAASEGVARITRSATIFNRDKARELLAPGWLCETEEAFQRLGFRARITLPEGLTRTADWYRNEGWL